MSPEPRVGSWVEASYADCPDRTLWKRSASYWVCACCGHREPWANLIDPIDALPPCG